MIIQHRSSGIYRYAEDYVKTVKTVKTCKKTQPNKQTNKKNHSTKSSLLVLTIVLLY